jgi:hypothetical protein
MRSNLMRPRFVGHMGLFFGCVFLFEIAFGLI